MTPRADEVFAQQRTEFGTTEYTENTEITEAFEKAPVHPEGDAGLLQKPL